jgi:DNA-3-methyladenine glycosylase II
MDEAQALRPKGPYNLGRSLAVMASFSRDPDQDEAVFRAAVRVDSTPVLVEVRQVERDPPVLEVAGSPSPDPGRLVALAGWMLSADLDLLPFYDLAADHPVFGNIVRRLNGLKPTRPSSLFQMAVIAITEQQISLEAAYSIRGRVVQRFGDPVDDRMAFPTAESLAHASMEELLDCGLSRRKAEYIGDLARAVVAGSVDLEELTDLPDDEVRSFITGLRGFGPWSADYILVRGMGRPDAVPADDLGIRTVVGKYLGDGQRMKAEQVRQALAPLAPYRGLAAFYLLADSRLPQDSDSHTRTPTTLHPPGRPMDLG